MHVAAICALKQAPFPFVLHYHSYNCLLYVRVCMCVCECLCIITTRTAVTKASHPLHAPTESRNGVHNKPEFIALQSPDCSNPQLRHVPFYVLVVSYAPHVFLFILLFSFSKGVSRTHVYTHRKRHDRPCDACLICGSPDAVSLSHMHRACETGNARRCHSVYGPIAPACDRCA